MTGVIDREFQKALVKDCINELLLIQNPRPEDLKLFEDVLKKYENKIYERAAHRIPVNTIDDKRIKEDLSLTGPRPGFGVGPSPGIGFGLGPQPGQVNQFGFSPQKNQGPGLPGGFGFPGAFPQFPHAPQEARNFGDPQANSKYYYPQDYLLHQNNPNANLNKPVNPQFVMPNVGIPDPLTAPNFLGQNQFIDPRFQPGGNPALHIPQNPLGAFPRPNEIPFQNFGQAGPGLGFPNAPNLPGGLPQGQFGPFGDEQFRLKRNVELIGGIERTLPNMERSLRDYEFKNLEQSLRSPPKRNNPGLTGTNPYDPYNQYNQYNQNQYNQFGQSLQNPGGMGGIYSPPPQYDTTNIRGASPIRGTTSVQNLSHRSLYTSPDRAPEYEQRQNNFMRNQYGQSEDRLRKEHKASLSFSKELRQQKLEGLGVKFNLRQEDDY